MAYTMNKTKNTLSLTSTLMLISYTLLLFLSLSVNAQENSEEPHTGSLYLHTQNSKQLAVSLSTHADFSIIGMSAKVKLIQEFTNNTDQWVEGVYVFPLPENSAVNYMAMHIGERLIEAEIKEKKEAKKVYEKAKAEGKKTALTIQRRPNLFTQKVANIPPGETIRVELRFLQNIRYDLGKFSIRFPLTVTPRYNPGQALRDIERHEIEPDTSTGWAVPTAQVRDADKISPYYLDNQESTGQQRSTGNSQPSNLIAINVSIDAGLELEKIHSSSHSIKTDLVESTQAHIRLSGGKELMDRDFILQWQLKENMTPQAALFHEHMNSSSYIQLMILPPQSISTESNIKRELILVIDTSGSMQGISIKQAKASAILALKQLSPNDNFNIIEFNSDYSKFSDKPSSADNNTINDAINWINALQADGGTNMSPALYAALTSTRSEKLQQIVFITDGAVGNEEALFKLIHDQLDDARLFTVGIGSAPNSFFMRKAAKFGRGSFTHIGDINEVKTQMHELFQKLNNAVATNIQIKWPQGTSPQSYPERIPDLYLGEPLLVTTKITNALLYPEKIKVTGYIGEQQWEKEIVINSASKIFDSSASNERSPIAGLWAREKIGHLLDKKASGSSEEEIKPQVLKTALEHQLMSPYTSFVAVEKKVSRAPEDKLKIKAVPNSRPHGQNVKQFNLPQTATSAQLNIVFGFFLLLALGFIRSRF